MADQVEEQFPVESAAAKNMAIKDKPVNDQQPAMVVQNVQENVELENLKAELKTLRNNVELLTTASVESIITRIMNYAARPLAEFNNYEALEMVESLNNTSQEQKYVKYSYHRMVYQTLRSKLGVPSDQFRNLEVARQLKVDLHNTWVSLSTNLSQGGVQDPPFTSSAAEARLKLYLKQMGADNGETLHGFRAGCAITLALTGADLSEIMQHLGWARRHTALYYMQLAKVVHPQGASARLAASASENVLNPWRDVNQLKQFVLAFPTSNNDNLPMLSD